MRLKAPARREQLMSVATALFAERGYDATTTAAIADSAGITEPVLYRHFDSKKEMFVAVLRQCSQLLISRWRSALSDKVSCAEQIRAIANAVFSALPEISSSQRVIYAASSTSRDAEVRRVLQEHVDQFSDLAKQLVQRGIDRKEFRDDLPVESMAWALVNHYTGFSFTRLHFPDDAMDIRTGIELLVAGLCKMKPAPKGA